MCIIGLPCTVCVLCICYTNVTARKWVVKSVRYSLSHKNQWCSHCEDNGTGQILKSPVTFHETQKSVPGNVAEMKPNQISIHKIRYSIIVGQLNYPQCDPPSKCANYGWTNWFRKIHETTTPKHLL